MKTVNVLCGLDKVGQGLFIHVLWKRGLNENAVNIILLVQVHDVLTNAFLICIGAKGDVRGANTESCARSNFGIYIDMRGRIVAHNDDGQMWFNPSLFEAPYPFF